MEFNPRGFGPQMTFLPRPGMGLRMLETLIALLTVVYLVLKIRSLL